MGQVRCGLAEVEYVLSLDKADAAVVILRKGDKFHVVLRESLG